MARRHPLVIAYIAALVPAMVMAITQPPWSRIDEAPNADFIIHLSHGVYPVADTTLLDPETVHVLAANGFFTPFYTVPASPAPDSTDTGPIPTGLSDHSNAVWMARHWWELSRESDQTPAYYLLMTPLWWAIDRVGGTYAAIYALRIVGALIIASLAPVAVALARTLSPARPETAAVAALFSILLPGLELNGPRISNDGLAAAMGGLLVLLAVRAAGRQWTWRRSIMMGLVLGLALMVKLTVAGLFPAMALSALWPVDGSSWRGRFGRLVVAVGIAVLCLGPWFLINLHNYGAPMPGARAARIEDGAPQPASLPILILDLAVVGVTYWSGEPWGVLPLALPFALFGTVLALTALAGVIRQVGDRLHPVAAARLAVATLSVVGMIAVALSLPAAFRFEFVGAGRYAYPAAAAAAALCGIGLYSVLRSATARRVAVGLYCVAAIGILGAGAAEGLAAAPQPAYTPGTPPADAKLVGVTATGRLRDVTISVNRVAFDPRARGTWFEVTASNAGPTEVDWPVVPLASIDGVVAQFDYFRSTHLPGDLDPGQSVSGWLFLEFDPARFSGGGHVLLRFQDVAVDNYLTVGDVSLRMNVGSSNVSGSNNASGATCGVIADRAITCAGA